MGMKTSTGSGKTPAPRLGILGDLSPGRDEGERLQGQQTPSVGVEPVPREHLGPPCLTLPKTQTPTIHAQALEPGGFSPYSPCGIEQVTEPLGASISTSAN